jgi:phage baseplate assembly protein W
MASPRDSGRDILGRGWTYPIRPTAAGRLPWSAFDEHIRQSIWLILATAPGERQMRPEFGCGIHDYVFQANTAALRGMIQARVREALVRWEPRVDIQDVSVETPSDDALRNRLLIQVTYRIRQNNALYNLVYPFFQTEGAR